MKKINTMKKMFGAALLFMAGTMSSYGQSYNNVWVAADVYPANSGTVFVTWYVDETNYAAHSEFKRSANFASDAFILSEPAEGFLFAGYARDYNGNDQYDNDADKQIHVWANGYFSALYDHTEYEVPGSSTQSLAIAQEALTTMEKPPDHLFAVFTKGAVAHRAKGQETHGKVYSSKLYNEVGDQVTFSAYGDSESQSAGGVKYFKFSHWTNAAGESVSTNREYTITVTGMETYYANFVETTKAEFQETEDDPNKIDWSKTGEDDPWTLLGVQTIEQGRVAASPVFDLQGRVVKAPVKGLFIKNGKKMVIR